MSLCWRKSIRGLVAAAALLAAGCDSSVDNAGSGDPEGDIAGDSAMDNTSLSPEEVARLRARAIAALRALLPNADEAAYTRLRPGFVGAICGEVNAGDATGGRSGPRPFIVTADGAAILSPTATLRLEDPTDYFPSHYARYCASAEELRRIDAQIEAMRPSDAMLAPPAPADDIAVPPDDAPDEPSAAQREPARRPADDSFFNSVLRSPRQDEPSR